MLQVYHANEGDDDSGGGFVEAAFFGDKLVGVLYNMQGGVYDFDFGFDDFEVNTGKNIVD
jgi:hypothetical protein